MIERTASCACRRVRLELVGEPILSAACCCSDCQAGGRLIEARQIETGLGAAAVRDEFGGTPYLIYRDDRFTCVAGAEALEATRARLACSAKTWAVRSGLNFSATLKASSAVLGSR